jgi:hypothetical protein
MKWVYGSSIANLKDDVIQLLTRSALARRMLESLIAANNLLYFFFDILSYVRHSGVDPCIRPLFLLTQALSRDKPAYKPPRPLREGIH